jgi:hypothetical protein
VSSNASQVGQAFAKGVALMLLPLQEASQTAARTSFLNFEKKFFTRSSFCCNAFAFTTSAEFGTNQPGL